MSCATLISRFFSTNAGAVAFTRTSYSNSYRFRSHQEREELLREPSAEQADAYLATHCIRDDAKRVYGFWERMPNVAKCGIGLQLYLFSLKFFAVVFFLCTLIAVYSLKVNCEGQYFENQKQNWSGTLGMLGNIVGFETNSTLFGDVALHHAISRYDQLGRIQESHVIVDGLYTLVVMVAVVIYAVWTRKAIEEWREKRPTLADFALKLTHVPEGKIMELAKILETCGYPIVEIVPVRHFVQLNNQLKRTKHTDKFRFLQALKRKGKRYSDKNMRTSNDKLIKYTKNCLSPTGALALGHSAIFVFERRVDCYLVHKMFYKNWLANLFLKMRYWFVKGEEKHKDWLREINAKIVPTPNDIYWENIRKKRYLRRYLYYCLSIFLIVLCFAVVYWLKRAQTSGGEMSMKKCMEDNENNVSYCNCLLNLDSTDESCSSQKSRDVALRVITGAVIIVVNSLLPAVLSLISAQEKQSSMPRRKLSTMVKCFFGLAFNTSFVILLAYANFKEYKVHKALPIVDGDFKDVSRYWYPEVGFPILTSMLIGIIMPHLPYSLYYSFKKHCLRCVHNLYDTQIAYNYWVIGCDIDLPIKVAYQLTVILCCYMYAGGIPLMLLICALTMLGMYISERYLLRYYEMPNEHSTILNTWFVKLLPLAIFCHCLFSLYSIDAETIFPHLNPAKWYGAQDYSNSFVHSAVLVNYTFPGSPCDSLGTEWKGNLIGVQVYNATIVLKNGLQSFGSFDNANVLNAMIRNLSGSDTAAGCQVLNSSDLIGGFLQSGHLIFSLETYLTSIDNSYITRVTHFSGITFLVLAAVSLLLPLITHRLETRIREKFMRKSERDLDSAYLNMIEGGQSYKLVENPIYHDAAVGMLLPRERPVEEEATPLILQDAETPMRLFSEISTRSLVTSEQKLTKS